MTRSNRINNGWSPRHALGTLIVSLIASKLCGPSVLGESNQPAIAAIPHGSSSNASSNSWNDSLLQPLLHGIARPQAAADLRTLVAGTVAQIHVQEGQLVKKGARLVTLDDRLVQAQVRIAEIQAARQGDFNRAVTQLRLAEKQLSRLEMAFERHAISDFEVEEQRARVEEARATHLGQLEFRQLAKANHTLALEQLRRLTIEAPFDGRITQLHAKPGESVDPTTPVISVADLRTLEVEMHTPLHLFGKMQTGTQVHLVAGKPVNRTLAADVVFTSPMINSASSTFRCTLRIDNSRRELPAGFSVSFAKASRGEPSKRPPRHR